MLSYTFSFVCLLHPIPFLVLTLPTFSLVLTLAISFEKFLSLPWWISAGQRVGSEGLLGQTDLDSKLAPTP